MKAPMSKRLVCSEYTREWGTLDEQARRHDQWRSEQHAQARLRERRLFERDAKRPQELELLEFAL